MTDFRFGTWHDRDGDEGLRDAWVASTQAAQRVDGFNVDGVCGLCGQATRFAFVDGADPAHADHREQLICPHCRQCSRVRAALELLRGMADTSASHANVYITEQVTPAYVWIQKHFGATVHGSEFERRWWRRRMLTLKLRSIGGRGDVQFQDVTALGHRSGSLDALATFDVLEHVPDYASAIAEFARVLKPGAACVATFPFTDRPDTIVRARLDASGRVEHLLEPEYHGDPISGGVLCYYHFGWDVLQRFRDAGFSRVDMVMPWGHQRGYFYGLWTLVAIR